jgi:hypothetical protein
MRSHAEAAHPAMIAASLCEIGPTASGAGVLMVMSVYDAQMKGSQIDTREPIEIATSELRGSVVLWLAGFIIAVNVCSTIVMLTAAP